MRVNYQRNHVGMLAAVFALMAVTLYMALAFPYSLLHLKQSETTEIKAVIIVARNGELTPARETYFDAFGEEPPEAWLLAGGPGQLTATGKERLYLLGKYLKLRYYERLLAGNPRKLLVRAQNSDHSLESAQALAAGLNPPRDKWIWSARACFGSAGSGSDHADRSDHSDQLAASWQPKAVHTTSESQDDLLSSKVRCLEMDSLRAAWKNSSRYSQLLNEFRHDLQILRQNTGLAFEDDLEMVAQIEEQLRARAAFEAASSMPSWYTSTLAQRLAHIADVTAGCRFSQTSSQRLFAGRLLDTLVKNVFNKIRSHLTAGISLLNDSSDREENFVSPDNHADQIKFNTSSRATFATGQAQQEDQQKQKQLELELELELSDSKLLPLEEQLKLKLERQNEPNVFVYMTDKQHLSALMNALKIFASQPHYGAALIIELHFDPANRVHFLRLFLVNSASHNVLPEPVRVNPIACAESVECSPQQFDKNLRHLMLDRQSWSSLCANADGLEQQELSQQQEPTPETTAATDARPTSESLTSLPSTTSSSVSGESGDRSEGNEGNEGSEGSDGSDGSDVPKATSRPVIDSSINETTTVAELQPDISDSIHLDKLDESLVVGPTTTTTTTTSSLQQDSSEPPVGIVAGIETPTTGKSIIGTILSETFGKTTTPSTTGAIQAQDPTTATGIPTATAETFEPAPTLATLTDTKADGPTTPNLLELSNEIADAKDHHPGRSLDSASED